MEHCSSSRSILELHPACVRLSRKVMQMGKIKLYTIYLSMLALPVLLVVGAGYAKGLLLGFDGTLDKDCEPDSWAASIYARANPGEYWSQQIKHLAKAMQEVQSGDTRQYTLRESVDLANEILIEASSGPDSGGDYTLPPKRSGVSEATQRQVIQAHEQATLEAMTESQRRKRALEERWMKRMSACIWHAEAKRTGR